MRVLLTAVVLVASSAMAAAIGGTISATPVNSAQGVPSVRVDVSLTCSLTCDASAPVKHFAIGAGMRSYYASAPAETGAYFAFLTTDLDLDGQASATSTNFKAGQTVFLKAESVTCWCGNRGGEGGYVDLTTPNFVLPANIGIQTSVRVGDDVYFSVEADLRGAEQVELKTVGGGADTTRVFGVADLSSQGYAINIIKFTAPGTVTATAKLLPSGVTSTATWTVTPNGSSTGGGTGSTGAGAGGGSGGGGSASEGCSTTGGLGLLSLLVLAFARRR